MPVSLNALARASKGALDANLKSQPIDQIAHDRPLLAALRKSAKPFPGALQYVTEKARKAYDSNFQWYSGAKEVTYNQKDPLEWLKYRWSSAHDGFGMTEDEATRNGIILTDDESAVATGAEEMQLINLLKEYVTDLRLGFDEKFDIQLHLDGTQDADAIMGLDGLISLTPTTGVVGGIDRATYAWWRNYAQTNVAANAVLAAMETAWRACTRNGGRPDLILMGDAFYDAFAVAAQGPNGIVQRFVTDSNANNSSVDPSYEEFRFKKVPIVRDLSFADLDTLLAPAIPWAKRCYMINTTTMKLRPAQGHDMVARKPPRVYNRYVHYQALTWKGTIVLNRSNGNAVLSLA